MKISTKGRYALRMMLDLAAHQGDGYVALKDIARRQEISKKYLEQIVPMLGKSDILRTTRGYQGGYRLARAPRDYTVGEILRLTEGGLAPVACLEQHPNASRAAESAPPCPCGKGWSGSYATISTASRFRICSSNRRRAPRMTTSSDTVMCFTYKTPPQRRLQRGFCVLAEFSPFHLVIWYYQESARVNSAFFIVFNRQAETLC